MPACELIDFAASRQSKTKIEANLVAALEEAEQIHETLKRDLALAHLTALSGMDAEQACVEVRATLKRLQGQMAFAEALAHRIALRRVTVAA